MSIEIAPFSRVDWYGWAGAESPDENTDPMIGYMQVSPLPPAPNGETWEPEMSDDTNGVVIVDKRGITINFTTASLFAGYFHKDCGFILGREWAHFLDKKMTYWELLALDFEWGPSLKGDQTKS